MLMLDAIERVEVGIRVDIAHILGRGDPWAHRLQANFNRYFNEADPKDQIVRHTKWVSRLDELCDPLQRGLRKTLSRKIQRAVPDMDRD